MAGVDTTNVDGLEIKTRSIEQTLLPLIKQEDQGRPLNPEGMILNENENQHYSDAACLDQSCSLIQKNTNVQELHTILEQCVEVNNQNENTLNEENKVDEANNYCCSSEKKVDNRKFDCTELQPLIHTLPENFATLDTFAPSSPDEDVRPVENEIFVEVHSEMRKEPIELEKINSELQKDSNQFEETNNTIEKYTDSDSLKFTDTTELKENAVASSFNFTLNSKCSLSSNNIRFDSKNLEVFNASEQSQKIFLTYELNVLKNTRFQVKELIHRYLAYKQDEKMASSKRKFSLQKVQNFNKTLNMVLFGRAHFKEGRAHYKRLEDFVNGSLPSEFVGELQNSYEYLFGATRHADVNYLSLIKLLMKQQTTEISNSSEITNKKLYSTNSQVNNPNGNSTESKTSRLKIDSPKKADGWKGQTQNDGYNNKKNKVSDDSVFDFDAGPSSAYQSYTQITRPDIETPQEITVQDVPTLCSNIEMGSLLAGHCSKNHTYEPLDSIDLLPPSELIDVTAASNQFGKIECAIKANTSITDSVVSSTSSEFAGKSEILANAKSNLRITLKNKPIDSDRDIQDVFNKSDIEFLKNYINDDLELLSTTRFKVKMLFHKFIAFKKDECNPISERKIELNAVQTLNKTLNMMFFGKAHFQEGGVHYRKLVAFVNGGIHSTSLRESLFNSYTYIFSGTRHANVNYMASFKLLLKTHKVIPAEKEILKNNKKTQHLKNSKLEPRSKKNSKNAKNKKNGNSFVSDIAECVKGSGQPQKSKVKTLKSVLKSRFKNESSYSNLDLQEFFIKSETDVLCNFVRNELDVLQNTTFKVKKLYRWLLAYEKMERTSSNNSLCEQKTLNVTLNSMLFGRAHLKDGGTHYRILEDFVKGVTTSNCTRESLYCSCNYIFGETRHDDSNYVSMIETLMKKLKEKGQKCLKI